MKIERSEAVFKRATTSCCHNISSSCVTDAPALKENQQDFKLLQQLSKRFDAGKSCDAAAADEDGDGRTRVAKYR